MKKDYKLIKKSLITTFAAVLTLFTSCNNISQNTGDGKAHIKIGAQVLLSSETEARTACYSTDVTKLTNIIFTGTRQGGDNESDNEISIGGDDGLDYNVFKDASTVTIQTGTWNFRLSAKLEGIEFYEDKTDVKITTDTQTLDFVLKTDIEVGGMEIVINFPGDSVSSLDRVEGYLLTEEDDFSETSLIFPEPSVYTDSTGDFVTVADSTPQKVAVTYNISLTIDSETHQASGIEGGSYWLYFKFYGKGITEPLNTVKHLVKVANGFTTKYTQDIDINEVYSISYKEYDSDGSLIDFDTDLFEDADTVPYTFCRRYNTILKEPAKTGYTFTGWSTAADPDTKNTTIPAGTTKDLVLIANWIPIGTGNITIEDNQLIISMEKKSDFYLNPTGEVEFAAMKKTTGEDRSYNDPMLSESEKVTWHAELRYGSNDINDFADSTAPYYTVTQPTQNTKLNLKMVKNFEISGNYQIYVTATYKEVVSSATFIVTTINSNLFEYCITTYDEDNNRTDIDLSSTTIVNDINSVSGYTEVRITGIATDSTFNRINMILQQSETYLHLDLSELDVSELADPIIGTNQFYASMIYSIELPEGITEIREDAFYSGSDNDYNGISTIKLPSTITEIAPLAFNGCNQLQTIKITDGNQIYKSICDDSMIIKTENIDGVDVKTLFTVVPYRTPFDNFEIDFTLYDDLKDVTAIEAYAFLNHDDEFTISNLGKVKTIAEYAFSNSKITSINLSGVEIIYDHAFVGTEKLTNVTIPESLYAIGAAAFYTGDDRTGSFNVTLEDEECYWYALGAEQDFDGTSGQTLWSNYITTKPGVSGMPSEGATVMSLTGSNNFTYFYSYISDGGNGGTCMYKISTKPETKEYTLSDTNKIDDTSLATDIQNLTDAVRIVIKGTAESTVFQSIDTILQNAQYPIDLDLSELVTGVTSTYNLVNDSDGYNIPKLRSFILPNELETISPNTFVNYYYSIDNPIFISITIPASVSSIGRLSINYIKSLKTINISSDNTKYKTIYNNTIIVTTNADETYNVIGSASGAPDLQTLDFSSGELAQITKLTEPAFAQSVVLESITSFGNIKTIPQITFQSCSALTSVNTTGAEIIEKDAFNSCSNLSNVTIASSVYAIGQRPFEYCSSSLTITMEDQNNWYKITDVNTWEDYCTSRPTTLEASDTVIPVTAAEGSSVSAQIKSSITDSSSSDCFIKLAD